MKTAPHNKPSPVLEGTVWPHCHPPPRPSTTGWSHRQEPSASGSLLVPPLEAPVGQMQAGSKFTSLFLGFDPLVHRSISVKRAPNGWSGGARHGNDSRTHASALIPAPRPAAQPATCGGSSPSPHLALATPMSAAHGEGKSGFGGEFGVFSYLAPSASCVAQEP